MEPVAHEMDPLPEMMADRFSRAHVGDPRAGTGAWRFCQIQRSIVLVSQRVAVLCFLAMILWRFSWPRDLNRNGYPVFPIRSLPPQERIEELEAKRDAAFSTETGPLPSLPIVVTDKDSSILGEIGRLDLSDSSEPFWQECGGAQK